MNARGGARDTLVCERRGCARLWIDAALRDAVPAIEWLDRVAHARSLDPLLAQAAGPPGRGPTAVLPLTASPSGGRSLHLRPLRRGGWLGPLWGGRILRMRRPLAELRATTALRERGAPVPRAALALGVRRGWGWEALVGTLYEPSTVDAAHFLAGAPSRADLAVAARAAGGAVRRFHDAGGRHADLHLGNLLVRKHCGDAGVDVLVVDLDRVRVGTAPTAARRMAELMRLYRSVRKRGLADAEQPRPLAAFLAGYVRGDRALRADLLRRLPRERILLALHASLYPARAAGS